MTLHLKDDCKEFTEPAKIKDLEKKYDKKDDKIDIKDGDDADKKKTKKVSEEVVEWNQVNSEKAIWTRSPRDVEDDDYNRFYKTISKDPEAPLTKMHFAAEGEIEFRSILFVPPKAPYDLLEGKAKSASIKLYVRRVFITDEFEDMMPRWLSFIKGVVDSEDLPLNVSREMLQTSKVLRVIKKKLVTKALEMIRKMA